MNKQHRELRTVIEGLGLKVAHIVPTRNGHLRIYIQHPDGRQLAYTTGGNNGDPRRMKNLERDVARYFRQGEIR